MQSPPAVAAPAVPFWRPHQDQCSKCWKLGHRCAECPSAVQVLRPLSNPELPPNKRGPVSIAGGTLTAGGRGTQGEVLVAGVVRADLDGAAAGPRGGH